MGKKWTPEKVAKILDDFTVSEFLKVIELTTGTRHSLGFTIRKDENEE